MTYSRIAVSVTVAGITLTNDGVLTVGTALSGGGTLLQDASSILSIGGTSGITGLDAFTNTPNVVNFNGAGQTVNSNDYNNLILGGSGAKTLQGGTATISGNLELSGTATTATVADLDIDGNLIIGDGTTFAGG